jgi:hypothetical protein
MREQVEFLTSSVSTMMGMKAILKKKMEWYTSHFVRDLLRVSSLKERTICE